MDGDLEQYKAPSPRLFLPLILFEKMYVNTGVTVRVAVKAGSAERRGPGCGTTVEGRSWLQAGS